jgi:glycosyltransferase involved in cell wall biosynthesis
MIGISVIIPCFNREAYISDAIESILSQEYDGIVEIIVADDGSTDRSIEIAESYGHSVIVVRKPLDCELKGAGPTRNRAIEVSTQPFIAFLDSDDFYLPGHLERLSRALEDHLDVGLVFDESKTMINGRIIRFPYPKWFIQSPCSEFMLLEPLPTTNSMMIRREVLSQLQHPFDPDLVHSQDIDFRLRISEKFPVMFVPGYGSVVREHINRSIVKNKGKKLFYYDMLMLKKAVSRYAYSKQIVRSKKAKLYYFLSISEFKLNKFSAAFFYLSYSIFQSPSFYFFKIKEKFLKNE